MESYFLEEAESLDVEKLDVRRYYRTLLKRWWIVVLVAIVVTAPWFWYLKQQPPIYEAQASIQFKNYAGNEEGLAYARTRELTSRRFAEQAVAQLGLAMRVENQGSQFVNRSKIFTEFKTNTKPVSGQYILRFGNDQTYRLSRIDPETEAEGVVKSGFVQDIIKNLCQVNGFGFRLVEDFYNLSHEITFSIQNFRRAVESFQTRVVVSWEDRTFSLMNLKYTDTDPVVVAETTNLLADIFIKKSTGVSGSLEAEQSKSLKQRLEAAKTKLDESDRTLTIFKQRHGLNLDTEQKSKLNKKSTLEKHRDDLETVLVILNSLLQQQAGEKSRLSNSSDPHRSTLRFIMKQIAIHRAFDNDPNMLVVRAKLNTLEDEWQSIAVSTSPQNFRAQKKLQEILKLHRDVESYARQGVMKLEAEVMQTKREISRLDYQLQQLPSRLSEYDQLDREHKVLEKNYEEVLNRYRDVELSNASTKEDIRILDPALPPEFPTNRDKRQKAAFGGIFGLLMGIGLVLVIEFMDKTIKTADDVKKYLRLPILGTIPQIDFEDTFDFQDSEKIKKIDQQLVTHDYSPTPIGEAYRSLRTNLMFTKDTGRVRSLVLTSNEPGDGKSFTAANLTITLAQLKSNTLLIDSDLRRGVLHNTFGVPKEPGFSNYLTEAVSLPGIVHETQIPNLSMISCGSLIPNPSELLGSHQMQRFLDEVKRKFDLIVFDTPPLNAATDAVVVGTQVDAVVLVIRAGKTTRDLAKSKLELFASVPAKLLGVVLNGTTANMAHPGYSYYHY